MVQGTDQSLSDSGGTLTVAIPKISFEEIYHVIYVTAGVSYSIWRNDLLGPSLRSLSAFLVFNSAGSV